MRSQERRSISVFFSLSWYVVRSPSAKRSHLNLTIPFLFFFYLTGHGLVSSSSVLFCSPSTRAQRTLSLSLLLLSRYLGSRTLLSMLEVVLEDRNMSAVPSILQNIETFRFVPVAPSFSCFRALVLTPLTLLSPSFDNCRIAMLRVGERLPFGHRQGTLVNTLLVDTLRPSSTLY